MTYTQGPLFYPLNVNFTGGTSSEVPDHSYRTRPCKHFCRGDPCPRGESCKFVHDLEFADIHREEARLAAIESLGKSRSPASGIRNPTSGRINLKTDNFEQLKHCYGFVQGYCDKINCRYLHPLDVQPYMKYTPCPDGSDCRRGPACGYRHPQVLAASNKPQVRNGAVDTLASKMYQAMMAQPFYRPVAYYQTVPTPISAAPGYSWSYPRQPLAGYAFSPAWTNASSGDLEKAQVLQAVQCGTPQIPGSKRGHGRRISVQVLR